MCTIYVGLDLEHPKRCVFKDVNYRVVECIEIVGVLCTPCQEYEYLDDSITTKSMSRETIIKSAQQF